MIWGPVLECSRGVGLRIQLVISKMRTVRHLFAEFELQPGERRLLASGRQVQLGPHALDLLISLVERNGELISKDELIARIWGKIIVEENTLQVHISTLRKVLGKEAITTVSGHGYRFNLKVMSPSGPTAAVKPKNNLPHALTSFIGREKEITEIRKSLTSTRLLTLSGTGGCGKTRLALQVAGTMLDQYPDGVWFVELGALSDPMLLDQAVAKILGAKEQAGKDLRDTIAEWLEPQKLLMVLDNAEHMTSTCAQFAESILRRCPEIALLVTTRERLCVIGELTYRVPSLSIPEAQSALAGEQDLTCDAARLFIDRAKLQRPDFNVTSQDAATLISICRRLDGIALAIELAAARVRMMSLVEMSMHLNERFDLLTAGSSAALPRHRTLTSLIDWSYELLNDAEKTFFRRIAVFAGGWTLEAAERVCSGGIVEHSNFLDLLTSMTDKNLVVTEVATDETRFRMLETVREYARDCLRDTGEEELIRDRHLEYFVGIADKLAGPQKDADRQKMLIRLDKDHDNLRAALGWCATTMNRSASGLRLAGDLFWFWRIRGQLSEGRSWIARMLSSSTGNNEGEDYARAYKAAGTLAYFQDDYSAAETYFHQALAIWQKLGHRMRIASALGNLGNVALNRGDYATAHKLMTQALLMAREDGDTRHIALGLGNLGTLSHDMGDLEAARSLLEECVSVSRQFGRWSSGAATARLARVRHAQGEHQTALTLLTEALNSQREFEDKQSIARTLVWLGAVLHDCGDIQAAKEHLKEALAIQQAVGDRVNMAAALEALACLSLEIASATDAARIWGQAQRLRDDICSPQCIPEKARCERYIAVARRAVLDESSFRQAWDEGRLWSSDDTVRYALSL